MNEIVDGTNSWSVEVVRIYNKGTTAEIEIIEKPNGTTRLEWLRAYRNQMKWY